MLDFINTQVVNDDELVELLSSDRDLMRWVAEFGLPGAPSSTSRFDGSGTTPLVLEFRQAARTLLEGHLDGVGTHLPSLRRVNKALTAPNDGGRLKRSESGWVWQPATAGIASVLRVIAEDLAALMTSPALSRVSRCANERCVIMFLDRSRGGRRRWCSMKICGNRAKVAAHHRRTQNAS